MKPAQLPVAFKLQQEKTKSLTEQIYLTIQNNDYRQLVCSQ